MHQTEHQQQPQHTQEPAQASSKAWEQICEAHAATLNAWERNGCMANCYRLMRSFTKHEAQAIALAAGHSVISTKHREFWQDLQGQIAEACRRRCSGWELRKEGRSSC